MTKEELGKALQAIRKEKGIGTHSITKDRVLRIEVLQKIEAGESYKIGPLLLYCERIGVRLRIDDLT